MSALTTLRISASGLTAQRARMDMIAKNIANSETLTGKGTAYRRQHVLFTAEPDGSVRVSGVESSVGELPKVPNPGHPYAVDGMVTMPDVNPVVEMVDMISASRSYEANVAAINATKTMIARALELARG